MSKILFFFAAVMLFANVLKADIPKFDIIELEYKGELYYYQFPTRGFLKEDFCYYDYTDNYIGEVNMVLEGYLSRNAEIGLYKSLNIIDFQNLPIYVEMDGHRLFVLNEHVILPSENVKGSYAIKTAHKGHTYGFQYNKELNESDNTWLVDYELEIYFSFGDGLCDLNIIGIKNNLLATEISILKARIEQRLKNKKPYQDILTELYRQNIIMLGMCSC